jgi:NADH dehydrogenase FAD-containing subunit
VNKKTILVIGGGAAGHQIAYQLRDDADVTLVDPKTYWEVPMAVPRLLVEPNALAARMRYDSFLGKARHIQGKVSSLADGRAQITLNDGSELRVQWDYAVIASGSVYMDPLIKAMNAKLRAARAVVIAGGGPVGVETAAELRETFPKVAVTLVHGGTRLLDRAPSKFPGWAEKALRARGVALVLGDMVQDPAPGAQPTDGHARTTGGRTLDADVVIWAGGVTPVTDFVAGSWPAAVQPDGRLKVDTYLRLEGHPNVFVAGDVTNLPEARLAIIGGLHAKSVAANLKAIVTADKPASAKLKPYKPAPPGKGMGKLMVVTLGRTDGLTSLPFGQFRASFLARKIKSRDMLVGMSRKAVAQAI